MSSQVTLRGRLTKEPELRYTNSGNPIAQFTVVTSKKFKDTTTQEWKEQDTSFWDVTAFGPLAENIVESCVKGTPVIVTGAMRQEKWQNKDGENRTSWKVLADDVALSLKTGRVDMANNSAPERKPQTRNDDPPF